MTLDAKTVNKQLRAVVRPMLKEARFTRFTERNAWRFLDEAKWIVNFQSFNAYLADGIGCTTYSFAVNLGVYLDDCAEDGVVLDRPAESQASFRFEVLKRLSQPMFRPYGRGTGPEPYVPTRPDILWPTFNPYAPAPATERENVYFVAEDGSNLEEVVEDARHLIAGPGLDVLQAHLDPMYAYCALFDRRERERPRSPSPWIRPISTPGYEAPHWIDLATALGRRLGRDVGADRAAGLPAAVLDSVLGRRD
jgi:hypothetical protein